MEKRNQQQGFRVGLAERRVELVASQDGQEFHLVHILRQPTTQEWIDYDRKISEIKFRGRKTKYQSCVLQTRIQLYDKLVIHAEGYWDEKNNSPLTSDTPNWQGQIPPMHKSEVIGTFGDVSPLDEEEEKNFVGG